MSTPLVSPEQPSGATPAVNKDADTLLTERRAALAKLGALAGYTAPAMLGLLVTPRLSAQSVVDEGENPDGPPG